MTIQLFSDYEKLLKKKYSASTLTVYIDDTLIYGSALPRAHLNEYSGYDGSKYLVGENGGKLHAAGRVRSRLVFVAGMENQKLLIIVSSKKADVWENSTGALIREKAAFSIQP